MMSDQSTVILSKAREPEEWQEKLESRLLHELGRCPGLDVTVIPHLYDLAPDGPAIGQLRGAAGDLIVLGWLYPRAAYWVLEANQVAGRLGRTSSLPEEDVEPPSPPAPDGRPGRTIWCFDLRTCQAPEPVLAEIGRIAGVNVPAAAAAAAREGREGRLVAEATRRRWYPVIDRDRCTNCMECLNFCLFGVYGLDGRSSILVERPDACRSGCPACSRICPAGAIMFPQHADPAIAGDPKASLEGLKLDLSQLFAGVSPADLAAAERNRALAERVAAPGGPAAAPANPAANDDLDRLVDEVDRMDL